MKCRACWSDKAYSREDKSAKAVMFSFIGLLPVKCHHCFHKAWVPWFMAWGQQTEPPVMEEPTIKLAAERESRPRRQPMRRAA